MINDNKKFRIFLWIIFVMVGIYLIGSISMIPTGECNAKVKISWINDSMTSTISNLKYNYKIIDGLNRMHETLDFGLEDKLNIHFESRNILWEEVHINNVDVECEYIFANWRYCVWILAIILAIYLIYPRNFIWKIKEKEKSQPLEEKNENKS